MTATATETAQRVVYRLEGTLLEACNCGVLCPCWIGEDPDNGTCDALVGYHFTKGVIDDVDVSGLNIVNVVHIPGNVLTPNSWRVAMFIDSRASQEQKDAIVNAFSGKLGGPLADLSGLVGEVVTVESADIEHSVSEGAGTLRVGKYVEAEMAPYRSGDGTITTLRDSVFSTVPGTPAYVAKASLNKVSIPEHGYEWEVHDRNAIQADYRMEFLA